MRLIFDYKTDWNGLVSSASFVVVYISVFDWIHKWNTITNNTFKIHTLWRLSLELGSSILMNNLKSLKKLLWLKRANTYEWRISLFKKNDTQEKWWKDFEQTNIMKRWESLIFFSVHILLKETIQSKDLVDVTFSKKIFCSASK